MGLWFGEIRIHGRETQTNKRTETSFVDSKLADWVYTGGAIIRVVWFLTLKPLMFNGFRCHCHHVFISETTEIEGSLKKQSFVKSGDTGNGAKNGSGYTSVLVPAAPCLFKV